MAAWLKRWLGRLLLSFQFLTRIPIPIPVSCEPEDLAGSSVFFPVAGLAVGGFMACGYLLGDWLGGALLGAALALAAEFLITGGLHIDGMADLSDALYSGKDSARMLEIMKDSRIGTHGMLGALLTQLTRFAGIYALASAGAPVVFALIALPAFGRLGIVCLAALGRYARPTGTGKHFIEKTGACHLLAACALALAAAWLLLGYSGLLLAAVPLIAGAVFWLRMKARFGGVTGDMLGACNEVVEALTLLAALLAFKVLP